MITRMQWVKTLDNEEQYEGITELFSRWSYFKPEEVLSPWLLEHNLTHILCPRSMDMLQELREYIDAPIICNFGDIRLRGARSLPENVNTRGAANSMHLYGRAFDIHSTGCSLDELANAAIKIGFMGIGRYATWVHVDTRFSNELVQWAV